MTDSGAEFDDYKYSNDPGAEFDTPLSKKPSLGQDLGDAARLLAQGITNVGGTIGYGLEKTGIAPKLGRTLQDSDMAEQQRLSGKMSPAMQEAAQQPFLNPDYQPGTETGSSWVNPEFGGRALAANVIPSLPMNLVMGVAGGPVAKGAELGLGALGVGKALATTAKGAKLVNQALGSGLGYGATEGIISGAGNAEQWGAEQRAKGVPEDVIAQGQSDIFKETALKTGALSALTLGGVYGVARKGINKSIQDLAQEGTDGFWKATGKGMLAEASQEAPQSFYEQQTTNKATRDYVDPTQDINEGALNAGIVGGISGGIMGAFGGAGYLHTPTTLTGAASLVTPAAQEEIAVNQTKQEGKTSEPKPGTATEPGTSDKRQRFYENLAQLRGQRSAPDASIESTIDQGTNAEGTGDNTFTATPVAPSTNLENGYGQIESAQQDARKQRQETGLLETAPVTAGELFQPEQIISNDTERNAAAQPETPGENIDTRNFIDTGEATANGVSEGAKPVVQKNATPETENTPEAAGTETGSLTKQPAKEKITPEPLLNEAKTESVIKGMPIEEVPLNKIALSKEVPQFKGGANKNGIVEPIAGKFERTGVAPVQLWQRNNGDIELISGRHRLDLAKRTGEQSIPSQIHKESEGFNAQQAATLDAELNIRDGQGNASDYINYFKASGITEQEAQQRGLVGRKLGRSAFTIAKQGSDDLITAHRNKAVNDEAAERIATTAPGNAAIQALGIKAAMDGKSTAYVGNIMEAVKLNNTAQDSTGDLFGFDDSAMRKAQVMAAEATREQNRLKQLRAAARIGAKANAVQGLTQGQVSVSIKNKDQLEKYTSDLDNQIKAWDSWPTHKELVDKLNGNTVLSSYTEEDIAKREAAADALAKTQAQTELKAQQKASADKEVDTLADEMLGNIGTNDVFGGNPLADLGKAEAIKKPQEEQWKTQTQPPVASPSITPVAEKPATSLPEENPLTAKFAATTSRVQNQDNVSGTIAQPSSKTEFASQKEAFKALSSKDYPQFTPATHTVVGTDVVPKVTVPDLTGIDKVHTKINAKAQTELINTGTGKPIIPGVTFKTPQEAKAYFNATKAEQENADPVISSYRTNKKIYQGRLIPWVKTWMWGGDGNAKNTFSYPNDDIIKQAKKYNPKTPVTLYRANDPTVPDSELQSWTRDKELAQTMADDAGRELITKTFSPDDIVLDVSKLDKGIQNHVLEHNWGEVIVANGQTKDYINKILNKQTQANTQSEQAIPPVVSNNAATVKQPWEQTKKEYKNSGNELSENYHKNGIVVALREGKNVPTHVLKEYPDIAKAKEEGYFNSQANTQATPQQLKAATRLRTIGQAHLDAAKELQSRDRQTNTAKRAREAGQAINEALKAEALAQTTLNIADAHERGETKALAKVGNKAQIEQLNTLINNAMYAADNKKGLSYSDQQDQKGRPPTDADIEFIKYPEATEDSGDWYKKEVAQNQTRLKLMGINNAKELKAAAKEFIKYRTGKGEEDAITKAERALVGQNVGAEFFQTPKPLAERMAKLAGVKSGSRVLEPSAGNGNLADAAKASGANVDTVEISSALRDVLKAKGYPIVGNDFNELTPAEQYDSVILNPPFKQDVEHVQRAYSMVKPGGKVVAIMGEHAFFASDKKSVAAREWLDKVGATVEKLPEGTFNDKSLLKTTGVNARLVTITKRSEPTEQEAINEQKKTYGISEGDATDSNSGWRNNALQRPQIINAKTSSVKSGVTHVNSSEDALHVISSFSDFAQEQMLAVVLDAHNKILQVVRHTVGLTDSSQVDAGVLAGAIHGIKGAKSVYFAHNHPSGKKTQSNADIAITKILTGLLRDTGVISKGMLVTTKGEGGSFVDTDLNINDEEIIETSAERTKNIPVTERKFILDTKLSDKSITVPGKGVQIANEVAAGREGILLMDNQHTPVSFIEMPADQMSLLRTNKKGTGASLLLQEIHETNARAMMMVIPLSSKTRPLSDYAAIGKNLSAFSKDTGSTRMLDIIVGNQSVSEMGLDFDKAGIYFSKTAQPTSTIGKELALFDGRKPAFDIKKAKQRRFAYNPVTHEMVIGQENAARMTKNGEVQDLTHAEEIANSGATGKYDDFYRGWLDSTYYDDGMIQFTHSLPDLKNPKNFDKFIDVLHAFVKQGANAKTTLMGVTPGKSVKLGDTYPSALFSREAAIRDIEEFQFSKNTQPTGSTVAQIMAMKPMRDKKIQAMVAAGKLKVLWSAKTLPKDVVGESLVNGRWVDNPTGEAEGLYDQNNDVAYLFSSYLTDKTLPIVLTHELIHRGEFTDPKLKAAFDRFEADLQSRFDLNAKGVGDASELAAYQRVITAKTPLEQQMIEYRAHLGEQFVKDPTSLTGKIEKIFKTLFAHLRLFLIRNGIDFGTVKSLSSADLWAASKYGMQVTQNNALATGDLLASAKQQGYKGTDTSEAFEWLRAVAKGLDMSQKARMDRAKSMGYKVKAFHGTKNDIGKGFNLDKLGESSGHNSSYLGFYFVSSPKIASHFSGDEIVLTWKARGTSYKLEEIRNISDAVGKDVISENSYNKEKERKDKILKLYGDHDVKKLLNSIGIYHSPGFNLDIGWMDAEKILKKSEDNVDLLNKIKNLINLTKLIIKEDKVKYESTKDYERNMDLVSGGNIIPVLLNTTGFKKLTVKEFVENFLEKDGDLRKTAEDEDVKNHALSLDAPGYIVPASSKSDWPEMHSKQFIVRDVSRIRSINAAFDPDFKDSSNLLASTAQRLAPTGKPTTININGVERPTTNSNQKIFVPPKEGQAYPFEFVQIDDHDYAKDSESFPDDNYKFNKLGVFFLPGGHIKWVSDRPVYDRSPIEMAVTREVSRKFKQPKIQGVYYRYTNNKNEISLLNTKTLRSSTNHRDNYQERGLSVSDGAHYGIWGYKYGYKISGEEIGTGSDGEILLDIKTVEPLSPMSTSLDIMAKDIRDNDNFRKKLLKKINWTEDQYKMAANWTKLIESEEFIKKYSIGNTGASSTANTNILFSKRQPQQPTGLPDETKLEAARRTVQDKMLRFQTIQEHKEIEAAKKGGYTGTDINEARAWMKAKAIVNPVRDETNVYQADSIREGIATELIKDFDEMTVRPLVKEAKDANLSMDDISDFLKMQHAEEANARIRKIKPDQPNVTAYGVEDAEAQAAMAEYQARPGYATLKAIADKWRGITDLILQIKVKEGIIPQEQADAYHATFQLYVPVKGADEGVQGTGKGLSVYAKDKRRLGHGERDERIIENIIKDYKTAIIAVEKNKVGRIAANFIREVNDPEVGTLGQPVKRQVFMPGAKHYMVTYHGSDVMAFDNLNDARRYADNEAEKLGRVRKDFIIDTTTDDGRVVLMAKPMLDENEFQYYENGAAIRGQWNDPLLAQAYKNLGIDEVGKIVEGAREINTFLSKAYTGWSPQFIIKNPIRDAIQGFITNTSKFGIKDAGKIMAAYPHAIKELYKHFKNYNASDEVNDYRHNGGGIGAAYLSDTDRIGRDMMAAYNEYAGAIDTYNRTYNDAIAAGKRPVIARLNALAKAGKAGFTKTPFIGHFVNLMENMNAVTENALRLATYNTLKESGYSKSQAAAAAKNLMNFNRKGEMTTQLGALYLFFNPNLQGTHVLLSALMNGPHKKEAQALAGTMVLAAFLAAEAMRGGDDDNEEKWKMIPDNLKDRNFIIGNGTTKYMLPVPYGYGIFHTLGNALSDAAHGQSTTKASIRMTAALFDNFSPFGNPIDSEHGAYQLLPTLPKMVMATSVNENNFGSPIMPDKWNEAKPDSQTMWRNTKGSSYAWLAETMNNLSGGSKYKAGLVDVSPEALRFWLSSLTGGAGQFAIDSINLGMTVGQGAKIEPRDIPVVKAFTHEVGVQDARQAYYKAVDEAKAAAGSFALAKQAHDKMAMTEMLKEDGPLLALAKVATKKQNLIKKLRDAQDTIRISDLPLAQKREQLKAMEKQEMQVYEAYIEAFGKAR